MPQVSQAVLGIVSAATDKIIVGFDSFDSSAVRHDLYRLGQSMAGSPVRNGIRIATNIDPSLPYEDEAVNPFDPYYYQLVSYGVGDDVISEEHFVMVVNTAFTGSSGAGNFEFTGAQGNYDVEAISLEDAGTQEFLGLSGSATIALPAGQWRLVVKAAAENGFNRISYANGGDRHKPIAVEQWGTGIPWASMYRAFWSCINLIALPHEPIPTQVSSFESAFRNIPLEVFPERILEGQSAASNFEFTFMESRDWLSTAGVIPSGVLDDITNATSIRSIFQRIDATQIPADLLIACGNVVEARGAFDLNNISSIPAGLMDPLVNLFDGRAMFDRNDGLSSIPEGLLDNCAQLEDFREAFSRASGSSSMTVPPTLFNNNKFLRLMHDIFSGRNLSTQNYSDLLIQLEANNPNMMVTFHGGNSTYSAGAAADARAILTAPRQITVSGSSDTDANGAYDWDDVDNIFVKANGYRFEKVGTDYELRDNTDSVVAEGTGRLGEGTPTFFAFQVPQTATGWTGVLSGATITRTGAGWIITDSGQAV